MRLSWVLLSVLVISISAQAADWPQFQGPDRTGLSSEKGLATSWPEGGPKELWKIDLNPGFGGAAVQGDKVYIMDRVGQKDVLHCLDLSSGKKLWDFSYDAPGKFDYAGPRATPTVEGACIYTVGPVGDLYCIDLQAHKPLWNQNLLNAFDAKRAHWAVAQSPVVYKEKLIVAPQGAKAGVAALDKKTGKVIWASEPIGSMSYASPLVTTIDGVVQVVMTSADTTVGVDIADGTVLWRYDAWRSGIPIVTATPIGDGRLFLTSIARRPYNSDCAMFRPRLKEGKWTVEQVFKNGNCQSLMHNALLYDKHLYANSSCNGKGLICMDLDGSVVWESRKNFDSGGNLLIADGMIYIMDGAGGVLHLVKATPEGYRELAEAPVCQANEAWAPMALSDGKLLCRDQKQLKCLDVK